VVSLIDVNEIPISSMTQIIQLISSGTTKRTSATTESNLISSRSHAILKVSIEVTLRSGSRVSSKLFIIDLAGSEKLSTESHQRKQEGSNINRSLLTLGNCINALVENVKRVGSAHVPYRDSKLTRLLKDSLGGTAKTVMIACISPHPFTLDETITTLNYAERAQGIKREVSKSVKPDYECPRCREFLNVSSPQRRGSCGAFDTLEEWQSLQSPPPPIR
jgi:kinesin family member 18/19